MTWGWAAMVAATVCLGCLAVVLYLVRTAVLLDDVDDAFSTDLADVLGTRAASKPAHDRVELTAPERDVIGRYELDFRRAS